MGTHGETGVEEEDASVSPWGEEAEVVGGWLEGGIVVLEAFVDVFEGGWCGSRWADGEAKAVGLIDVVIGILTENNHFDFVERSMAGPVLL